MIILDFCGTKWNITIDGWLYEKCTLIWRCEAGADFFLAETVLGDYAEWKPWILCALERIFFSLLCWHNHENVLSSDWEGACEIQSQEHERGGWLSSFVFLNPKIPLMKKLKVDVRLCPIKVQITWKKQMTEPWGLNEMVAFVYHVWSRALQTLKKNCSHEYSCIYNGVLEPL